MVFKIQENNAQKALISLEGELDTAASQDFAAKLQPFVADSAKEITFDFSKLEYISSSGMRAIMLLNKTALANGGKVFIKGMSEDIRQLFQMTGFDQMMEIQN